MKGFLEFLRSQGVVGLAVGFILGGAVSKLVTTLVEDVINPILGLILGFTESLSTATVSLGSAEIGWGNFVSVLIDFLVVSMVVYFSVKILRFDRLDKKK